jgi:hypothetical protein
MVQAPAPVRKIWDTQQYQFCGFFEQLKALTWRKDLFGIIECRTEVSVGAGLDFEAKRLL